MYKVFIYLFFSAIFCHWLNAEEHPYILFQEPMDSADLFRVFTDNARAKKEDSQSAAQDVQELIEYLEDEHALDDGGHTRLTTAILNATVKDIEEIVNVYVQDGLTKKQALNPFLIQHNNGHFYTPAGYLDQKDELREYQDKKQALCNILSENPALTHTPLVLALQAERFDIVHFLLDQPETNINAIGMRNETILLRVICTSFNNWNTKVSVINHILSRQDLNPNIPDSTGCSPLTYALLRTVKHSENLDIVTALLQHPKIDLNNLKIILASKDALALVKQAQEKKHDA